MDREITEALARIEQRPAAYDVVARRLIGMLESSARSTAIPRCAACCATYVRPQLLEIDEVGYLS